MDPADTGIAERLALLDLANSYVLARALQVAAEIGIADALAQRARPVAALASDLGVPSHGLESILRLLASHGIFEERTDGRFGNTPRSALLRADVPGSVRDAVVLRGDPAWWQACTDLSRTVRTGRYAGPSAAQYYASLERDPAARERFDRGMAVVAGLEDAAIGDAVDWADARRIVDVGGGRGGFLAQALLRSPAARGVLLDTPGVVTRVTPLEQAGVLGRCEIVGGDFRDAVPAGGDVYILKRILHSFADADAIALLQRCAAAAAPGARLLTIEVLRQAGNAPHRGKLADVLLLMLGAEGRERSDGEMRALHAAAGLVVDRVLDTPAGLSIVESRGIR